MSAIMGRILSSYIFRRILLIFPTLIGILLINFIIIQAAPGGPVDQAISRLMGEDSAVTASIGGGSAMDVTELVANERYESSRGLDPELIAELEAQFGFDKPAHERFLSMVVDYFQFDFGNSFYQDVPVLQNVIELIQV